MFRLLYIAFLLLTVLEVAFVASSVPPDPGEALYTKMERELKTERLFRMHAVLSRNPGAYRQLQEVERYFAYLRNLDRQVSSSDDKYDRQAAVERYAKDYSARLEKLMLQVELTDKEMAQAACAVGDLVQQMADEAEVHLNSHWSTLSTTLSYVDSGYPFWRATKLVDSAQAQLQGVTSGKEKHERLLAFARQHYWDARK
jgi:hypothetical protein